MALDTGEVIVRSIGQFGRWQLGITLLIFIARVPVGWHTILTVIVGPPSKFECIDKNITMCSPDCKEHVYDKSIFEETIVMKWDLVCNREDLLLLQQMCVMFGILVGNFLFGRLGDIFGRKYPFIIAIVLQTLFGTISAFSPYLSMYITFRFLCTIATGGSMLTGFVLLMEFVGPKYRTIVGVLFHLAFQVGHASLGLIGYLIRKWNYMQLAVSIPPIIYVLTICILPESPRWLMTRGKTDKAIKMLESAAKCNKMPIEAIRDEVMESVETLNSQHVKPGKMFDLVRTKRMRLKTLCLALNWLTIALSFYAIAHYMGYIAGNIFINVASAGLMQMPGDFIIWILMEKFGRKKSLLFTYFITYVSAWIIIFLPEKPNWPTTVMGSLAMMGMSMAFCNIYIYSGELYPTVIRNSGIGTCSTISRVGSMVSPFLVRMKTFELWIPWLLVGILPFISSIVTLIFLPETLNVKMPDTIEEAEEL